MNRRRFVPRSEDLESRQLLSTAAPAAAATPSSQQVAYNMATYGTPYNPYTPNANTASNIAPLQSFRIDHLPQFLYKLSPGRIVSPGITAALQEDLRLVQGELHRPAPGPLSMTNVLARSVLSHRSLHVEDVLALNHNLGNVLRTAGAIPQVADKIVADMTDLAQEDVSTSNPTMTTINDYTFMTQIILGVGVVNNQAAAAAHHAKAAVATASPAAAAKATTTTAAAKS